MLAEAASGCPGLWAEVRVPGPMARRREMWDLGGLRELLRCRSCKRRAAHREGGGGGRPGERAEEAVDLSRGTGSVPATPWLF